MSSFGMTSARLLGRSLPLLAALASTSAYADDCSAPYTHAQWKADMDAADESLSSFNLEQAHDQLIAIHKGVLCLNAIAQPSYIARIERQLTLVFFFDQDEAAATRWAAGSSYAYAGLPWPSDLGEDHPLRALIAAADPPQQAGPADKGLLVPKKGFAFVDGKLLKDLKMPVETPVFVQITDKDGLITREYWQDGAAWPDDLLGPPLAPFVAPAWYVPETPDKVAQVKSPLWGGPAVATAGDADGTPSDTVAVAVAPPPPPPPPAHPPSLEPALPEGAPVQISGTASLSDYVDPFLDAKMRAVVKERSVRTEVDGSGKTRTVTTEVITFVADKDASGAVKASDFADWIAYRPEWQHDAAIAAKHADKGYLSTWVNGVQPGDPAAPAVWVSFLAAKAYCDDWSSGLAEGSVAAPPPVVDEWRLIDGKPALRSMKTGPAPYTDDLTRTSATIGFRCLN